MTETRLALDRASVRTSDDDGHMHVARTPISKANVCPYYGREIPDYEALGLSADKTYKLYRDAAELEKAVDSFNGKPLLFGHHMINADNHDHDVVVGSVTGAEWDAPYLYARLDIWPSEATRAIDSGEHEQLSSAYRYTAVMEPGTAPDGSRYDGRMTAISGSHVAIVPEGRAGPDVVVLDAKPSSMKEQFMSAKAVSPRTAASAAALSGALSGALMVYARPKMATDAKLDVLPLVKGVTAKNAKAKAPVIARALDAALRGKLAKDAEMDPDEVKDIVEQVAEVMSENSEAIAAELSPDVDATTDDDDSDLRAMLKAKGFSDDEVEKICAMKPGEVMDPTAPAVDAEKVANEAVKGMDAKLATVRREATAEARRGMVEQTAMDTAISIAVDGAVSAERQRNKDIREAEAHIASSPVGKLAGAFDSAPDVFRAGLSALGVKDTDKLHDSALKAVFDAHAGLKAAAVTARAVPLAADAATSGKSFAEMFPGSARFVG